MKTKKEKIVIGADMVDDSEPTTEEWAADSSPSRFYAMMGSEARAAFDQAKKRIAKNQATLKQVRLAKQQTQIQIAKDMEMTQGEVSKLERRSNMMLATLRKYIEATGGNLELVAHYPDGSKVRLDIDEENEG